MSWGRELRYPPADTNDYVQCPYCSAIANGVKQLANHLSKKHNLNERSQRVDGSLVSGQEST